MEFKEALKEILKIKGSSALEDEDTLNLLEDYGAFEEYPVFKSIMSNIIAMKIGKMLQNTFYYSVEDNGHAWGQMKDQLLKGLPCDKIFVNLFLDAIEYAFMGYAFEKGVSERNFNSEVEEMLGQVWTDNKGCKYSSDKKKLINGSEVEGAYIVNPETKYIDPYAFQQNSRIERITFSKKLDKIGSHSFQNCSYLNTVDFKDDVSEICECAFGGCASIKEVHLPNGLHMISDGLFSVCTNLLYVHFPQSVTHIGANAFSDCLSLQYVVIPDNVTSIGDFAFKWCKSLYYVVLPSKLTSVGEGVFENCKNLRYIGIPEGTKSKYTNLMPRYANLFIEYNKNELEEKEIVGKETLSSYHGKENVTHFVLNNGTECWLTQERSFEDEANANGACKLNTIENEKKHVLFLFDSNNKEVGRYYLGKKLQGKTPEQLVGIKHSLVFFESWNTATKTWVPCVGIESSNQFAKPNISFRKEQKPPFPPSGSEMYNETDNSIKTGLTPKIANKNKLELSLHICEMDINANGDFQNINEEMWSIGERFIITPHGTLQINDTIFVDKGSMVGVQFSVTGKWNIHDFDNSSGSEKDVEINTFALMRQPNNVWLWVYAFNSQGDPVVNFCGYDDLDGFAKFIPSLKQLINVDKNISTSEWGCDPRLYGKWYSVQKSIHPVLNTIDYSLTVDFYNEDGTMLKHLQLGMKSPDFSPNIRWGKYVFEWKTKNNEILITNEDLRLKEKMKYDCENEVLTKNNVHYYRTLEDAINAINL